MIICARSGPLGLSFHAVDDSGSLCGTRPADGRWRPTTRFPVSCPRCLYAMSQPRYAFSETPTAASFTPWHVRLVGSEGISRSGYGRGSVKALCGMVLGWDVGPLVAEELKHPEHVCRTCVRLLDAANAVR